MQNYVKKMDFVNYIKKLREFQTGKKDRFIMLELALNSYCNLKCNHCSAVGLSNTTATFDLEELDKLFDQAAREGFLTVVLVGGEPTLYPSLTEAIQLIKKYGMFPSMITNGYKITEADLQKWASVGLGTICFSLHGMNAQTHDQFVNVEGAFDSLMNSINLATKIGIKVAISVTPIHQQIQSGEFHKILEFIRNNKFAINFNYPAVAGRYKNAIRDLLTEEELQSVKKAAKGLNQWSDFYLTGEYKCIAAKNGIYVSVEGDVCPCAFIHVKFGNIKKETLDLVLERMKANNFFNRVHNHCLVGENLGFVKDYIYPIYDNNNTKPLYFKDHCLLGGEKSSQTSNNYERIFKAIVNENKLFEKSLMEMKNHLENNEMSYFKFREEVSAIVIQLLEQYKMPLNSIGKAYKKIVLNYLKNQKVYNLTDKYPAMDLSIENIKDKVYDSKEYMTDYMLCLLITYILWPNKYNLIRAFEIDFSLRLPNDASILDIGTGHGYFLARALHNTERAGFGYDLSEHSLKMAQHVLEIVGINSTNYKLVLEDVTREGSVTQKFDAIIFSEVIEHVDNPDELLQMIKKLLKKDNQGIFFVTALNTATDDHVQVFRSQNDVRDLLKRNGYSWKNERVYPQFGLMHVDNPEEIKMGKIPAAYSAVIYPDTTI